MPLRPSAAIELVHDRLWPALKKERDRLTRIDSWYRWDAETPQLPPKATKEMRRLVELAKTPWLGIVVTTTAQAMYVDGHRSPEVRDNSAAWRTWVANDFDQRQIAIHRSALAYGTAYVTVLPGTNVDGPRSVMRGVSPRKMLAFYADPAEDDWPMFALRAQPSGNEWVLRLYDEEAVYYLSMNSAHEVTFIERRDHDAGVCPVVRYANLDLDGRSDGDVEPFINVAARINKTAFDRLLTQHFTSWKVRTATGISQPETDEEANRLKLQLRQDDILIAEDPDTRFDTLDETPLDGFIKAYDSDIETMAAVTQTPSTSLNGKVSNLSAEALAELRAGHTQKVTEWQKALGKSHEQALRLAATLEGDDATASDFMARVTWQDTQIRSMAQAADALGKYAQMLGIPPQALWSRIPGVTKSDVDEWKALAAEGDAFTRLGSLLDAQAGPPAT